MGYIITYAQEHIAGSLGLIIIILLSFVEVSKIHLNPWSALFNWLGKKLNADLTKKVDEMETELTSLKEDCEVKNAHDKRWAILDFANSCRNNRKHSKEEWEHVLEQIDFYESYVEVHKIKNAVIVENTKYLRGLYSELLKTNNFMV